jgi:ADP-ribose pyrophosphatase YjhB (NUDIX family)
MDKRVSSRAVIIQNGKLLAMFRRKTKDDGTVKEYYALPGGGQEEGETLEQNVTRELKEEFGVDINVLGYLGKYDYEASIDYFFHCEIEEGIPTLGGEELERMTEANYYEVSYIDIENLQNVDINAKDMIEKAIKKEYDILG